MKNPDHLGCFQHNAVRRCHRTIFIFIAELVPAFLAVGKTNGHSRVHCNHTAEEYRQKSTAGPQYAVLSRFAIFLLQKCNIASRSGSLQRQAVVSAVKKKGAEAPFFLKTDFYYLKVYVALSEPLIPCGLWYAVL